MSEDAPNIQYSNWTQPVLSQPDVKEAHRIASKLKSYVNSTKFIREGQKAQVMDQETGTRQKLPAQNVQYYNPYTGSAMTAQQLQNAIRHAVLSKNPDALREVAGYNFVSYDKGQDPKLKIAREIRRKKAIRTGLLAAGATLGAGGIGLFPIWGAYNKYKTVTAQDMGLTALTMPLGIGVGLALGALAAKAVL